LTVDHHRGAHDVARSVIAFLPDVVAHHHDRRGAGFGIRLGDGASQHGLDSEQGEHVPGELRTGVALGPLTRKGQIHRLPGKGGQTFKRGLLFPPILEIVDRRIVALDPEFLVGPRNQHQLVGVLEWEAFQDGGVDDAEDGGGEPDTQAQGDYGDDGQHGVLDQHPNAELKILPQGAHDWRSVLVGVPADRAGSTRYDVPNTAGEGQSFSLEL